MTRSKLVAVIIAVAVSARLSGGFLDSLTPEQKKELGLDRLTPAQVSAIDVAVDQYHSGPEVKALTQQAATAAVEEYKAKQEPGVIARALSIFKLNQDEQQLERRPCHVVGSFTGWSGHTLFHLDNGEVWQQVGSEINYIGKTANAAVELRKSPNGYYRIYLPDDSWTTVKRVK